MRVNEPYDINFKSKASDKKCPTQTTTLATLAQQSRYPPSQSHHRVTGPTDQSSVPGVGKAANVDRGEPTLLPLRSCPDTYGRTKCCIQ